MKKNYFSILTFLFLVSVSSVSSAAKCSEENLLKLIEMQSKLIGLFGEFDGNITKIFTNHNYLKSTAEAVRKLYITVKKDHTEKASVVASEIQVFAKMNPDCDKTGLLLTK